jgi:hypothetical protein
MTAATMMPMNTNREAVTRRAQVLRAVAAGTTLPA